MDRLKVSNSPELSRNQWIKHKLNVLIIGSSGCGKTYIACAMAHRACLDGYTRFISVNVALRRKNTAIVETIKVEKK